MTYFVLRYSNQLAPLTNHMLYDVKPFKLSADLFLNTNNLGSRTFFRSFTIFFNKEVSSHVVVSSDNTNNRMMQVFAYFYIINPFTMCKISYQRT